MTGAVPFFAMNAGTGGLLATAPFILPLEDAGAGAVNTTLARGTGSATFTRATTATTVNSAGLIVSVGLNLCLQSEDFATTWGVSAATISANSAVAPDGATTADQIVEDGTSAQHFSSQGFTKAASAIAYSLSVFVKPAGRNYCGVRLDDAAGNGARADFTLTGAGSAAAVVGLGTPFTALSSTITAYPNGWYRCTLLVTSNTATDLRIILQPESASGTVDYQGDSASGIYLWGAQLETGSTATAYAKTTTAANSSARSYYDPSTLAYQGYLAEGARTNVVLQSNGFGTTWANQVGTPTQAQDATGPDGTTSAWTVTDNDAASLERKNQDIVVANDSTSWTLSFFIAKTSGAASFPGISLILTGGTLLTWEYLCNTNAGTMTARTGNSAGATVVVKEFPLFYRFSISGANNTTGNVTLRAAYIPAAAATDTATWSAAVTGTAVIYGAQAEAGAFPSTYIPTTTVAVTRNADVLTYAFAGNADAAVGTAYAELSTEWATATGAANFRAIGFTNNGDAALGEVAAVAATSIYTQDGTTTITKGGLTSMATGSRKRASCWGGSVLSITGDGATVATGAFDGDMGSTGIGIGCRPDGAGNWFGTLKNIRIWQTQFTAAQLSVITS